MQRQRLETNPANSHENYKLDRLRFGESPNMPSFEENPPITEVSQLVFLYETKLTNVQVR